MPIHGYPGNIITANPTAPTSSVASGVWTTEQQLAAKAAGNWPTTIPTQQISRSLRFNSADTAYLSRTGGTSTSRRIHTFSFWTKYVVSGGTRAIASAGSDDNNREVIFIDSNVFDYQVKISSTFYEVVTTQVFRDPSSWYHFVVAVDTTQATGSNRVKIYLNGTQITAFSSASYPPQNSDLFFDDSNGGTSYIGALRGFVNSTYAYNGYITELYFIDGQALTPSSFGQTNASTGVWEPIAYSGTYGTNGFYLNFSDNSGTTSTTLGKDYSGNGNNWTPNNFSVTAGAGNDSLVDTPTQYGTDTGAGGEVRGNYATLNPLGTNGGTFTNGNLEYIGPTAWRASPSTILLPSTGKWYVEGTLKAAPAGANFGNMYAGIGVIAPSAVSAWSYNSGTSFYVGDTGHYANYSATSSGNFSGNTSGTVLSLAIDRDNNQVTIYQNGTNKVTVTLGITSGTDLYVFYGSYDGSYGQMAINFGQRPFAYTAPSGFKALCVQNLSTPTIGATSTTQANDYMNVVLYTGTGSARSVTGVGFQPDFTWIKMRSGTSNHALFDAVRGATKWLASDLTQAETTDSVSLTAFDSDGFSLGTGANLVAVNNVTSTFVAWNWNAGGSNATNTSGTITSTVRANTTSGFSIVAYTGNGSTSSTQTVGHGLGVKPAFIITKYRSGSPPAGGDRWSCWHQDLGGTNAGIFLDLANARNNGMWAGQASISSTVFVPADLGYNNVNGATYINYVFAPVAGYSAFGSYTGNASTDGPFVYLGFRPRFIMIKAASNSANWVMFDSARSPYNDGPSAMPVLYPNLTAVEDGAYPATPMDFLSNGFKLRISNAGYNLNDSGYTFIYAAFAEFPFKYSLAR